MADYLKKGSLKPDLKIAKHTKDNRRNILIKVDHTIEIYVLYRIYKKHCGFSYVPHESEQSERCEKGPIVFLPHAEGTSIECPTICKSQNKDNTFPHLF